MKRLILTLTLAIFCLIGFSQTNAYRGEVITVVNALAPASLTGADTTIYVTMPVQYSPAWSATVTWTTITGSGTCAIMTAHSTTYWEAYNSSPSVTLTTGNDTYIFEDDMFAERYLGFKITKGTISAGTVTVTLLLK